MKRSSGVILHVSSLWGDYSEGSFGKAAREWIDFLSDSGFTYWQVLPFCLPDEMDSPYKSFSAFSENPMFIDLPLLAEDGLLTEDELLGARQASPYACEFDRLHRERLPLLAKAMERFRDWDAIRLFLKQHPHTDKFCSFMALKKANNDLPWQEWSVQEPDEHEYKLWCFTQYQFYIQWKKVREYASEKGVRIIGDIPIYVALDSSDVWSEPYLFQLNDQYMPKAVAGVPPDYFSADGQLWGNPLYDWNQMKADGYSWWKDRMTFMLELFDGVRIDHFRGLESYFSIPAQDTTARNGVWKKGPGYPFIQELKKICKDRLIIAEDLGDITPAVRSLVNRSGFPGMRVFQFAFLGDCESPHLPHNYIDNCVAYTGTHDNNTLLGYIWEQDSETRKKILSYCGYDSPDWDAGYDSILRTMLQSHAGLVIFPVQDLLLFGSDTRMNKPGIGSGNWSYRIAEYQIKNLDRGKFRSWNRLYGRAD